MKDFESPEERLLSPIDAERVIHDRVYAKGSCIRSSVDMTVSLPRGASKEVQHRVRKEMLAARALCAACVVKHDCAIISYLENAGGINGYTEATAAEQRTARYDADHLPAYELRTRPDAEAAQRAS